MHGTTQYAFAAMKLCAYAIYFDFVETQFSKHAMLAVVWLDYFDLIVRVRY